MLLKGSPNADFQREDCQNYPKHLEMIFPDFWCSRIEKIRVDGCPDAKDEGKDTAIE